MNIELFQTVPWECSWFKGIPISEYNSKTMNEIQTIVGRSVRVRFRGPRPEKYGRSKFNRQSTCLKEDAQTFAVYLR